MNTFLRQIEIPLALIYLTILICTLVFNSTIKPEIFFPIFLLYVCVFRYNQEQRKKQAQTKKEKGE